MYNILKCYHFLPKKCEELNAKVPYIFSAKNTVTVDFVSAVTLNKSSTNDFVKLCFEKPGPAFFPG